MDDDPDIMLRQTLIICGFFWLVIISLAFLSACTPTATVQHEVPQLQSASDSIRKTSDSIRLVVDKMASAPMQCPTLEMPPIPKECVIDILGDSMTASSPECESLIRHYVAARQLLKQDVPKSTAPTPAP